MNNTWDNLKKPINSHSYSAILCDKELVLKFYWAKDFYENKIFLLQLSDNIQEIKKLDDILGIKIIFEKINNTQQLSFVLTDIGNDDMFYLICNDLLEKTRNLTDEQKAINVLLNRLDGWRRFLKSKRKVLDKRGLIGLIAELYFLKNELFLKFGIKQSLNFWKAPIQEKQDFIVHDIAIEIKTKSTQNKITISSFEQLNTELNNLYIYVVTITESSQSILNSINALQYIENIKREIATQDIESLLEFEKLLFEYGYFNNPECEQLYFFIGEKSIYKVENDFPKISSIQSGIESLTYKINLDSCQKYEVANIKY